MISKPANTLLAVLAFASLRAILGTPLGAFAADDQERTLFIASAVENDDDTATFPLHLGKSQGRDVWYIVLDSSDGNDAKARGVNHSQKLNNARGTRAVQKVRIVNGVIHFPATVDFSYTRAVQPGPNGFPPNKALPGAIGEPGYSPLIELPNGVIINAPHLANESGRADKVRDIDFVGGKVVYKETHGFQGGRGVKYVSTDASDEAVAALEDTTWAPELAEAPSPGADGTDSVRASLAAFVNGQTGAENPQRQGLSSALLDGLDPLNVLFWNPTQGRYSPLWDVFPAQWSAAAVANGHNALQAEFGDVENLARQGLITGPGGAPFGAANFVVNCPIVSRD